MSEPVKIMSAKFDPNAHVYCIKYQADRNGYWAELTLESVEPARPEFDEAFDAMAPDFCALIAMSPDAYNPEADPMSRVHVSQVTSKEGYGFLQFYGQDLQSDHMPVPKRFAAIRRRNEYQSGDHGPHRHPVPRGVPVCPGKAGPGEHVRRKVTGR